MYNSVFCFFSFFLCLSLFVSLSVSFIFFLVASFDGLRPLLVTIVHSVHWQINFVRSFVRLFLQIIVLYIFLSQPNIMSCKLSSRSTHNF